jgi:hypothetical protein
MHDRCQTVKDERAVRERKMLCILYRKQHSGLTKETAQVRRGNQDANSSTWPYATR